jgi:hypothetical protein
MAPAMFGPLVERHYILPNATKNLPVVAQEIPQEVYDRVKQRVETLGLAQERSLGIVADNTAYYFFQGCNVFLRYGLAQVGTAKTIDNMDGFPMIRLFANSVEDIGELESLVALSPREVAVAAATPGQGTGEFRILE